MNFILIAKTIIDNLFAAAHEIFRHSTLTGGSPFIACAALHHSGSEAKRLATNWP
jgi:hypothetical protein